MLKAKHVLIAAIFVVSYSIEFSNIKSTDPPELSQLANKTYADLALENMRLKLYQELGFEIRGAFANLESKIDYRATAFENKIESRMIASDLKMTAFENKIDSRLTASDLKMEMHMNITDTRLNSMEGKLYSIEGKLSALTTVWNLGAAAIGAAATALLGGIAAILMKVDWGNIFKK